MGWPSNYLNLHQPLEIRLPSGVVGEEVDSVLNVAIQHYQNTGSAIPQQNTTNVNHALKQTAVECFREFSGATASERAWVDLPPHFSEVSVSNVHIGKGSAAEIRAVLQLLVWSNSRKGESLSPFWKINDTHRWLRNYCQLWIGLDCLGFVVNAMNVKFGHMLRPVEITNFEIRRFTDTNDRILRSIYELEEGTAAVYLNNELGQRARHIALVDSVGYQTKDLVSAKLVESVEGAGLQTDMVEITHSGLTTEIGTVFYCQRMSNGETCLVYLCRLPF
jgi:hypothetical protein